ncbi:radical SAM protein [bacterium]|nr:radical SAM protein [bacterium]MCB2179149.1 radical SAM protein [bacterium]
MESDKFFLSEQDYQPAYLSLAAGELAERANRAMASLEKCTLCPRRCGANRVKGFVGTCSTKMKAIVSSAAPHPGEEACLCGSQGSGTIFFAGCNLRCAFCQNYEISHRPSGKPVSTEELAEMMLTLQSAGSPNINLVTPDHVVPQILAALEIAASQGLHIPLVYNTSAYSSIDTLRLMDGVVDIYMPDFKMADASDARLYLQAKDYPEVARQAIQEMHRQTGDLLLDEYGLAKRGVLVRYLVMPEHVGGSEAVMDALAEISTDMYVNIMGQYHPAGLTEKEKYARIHRPVDPEEVEQVYRQATAAGLWRFDA